MKYSFPSLYINSSRGVYFEGEGYREGTEYFILIYLSIYIEEYNLCYQFEGEGYI